MRKSSIAKYQWQGRSGFARRLGQQLRRFRVERGLTQAQMAAPFSVGFVSAVETGAIMPSLPSLVLLLEKVGIPLSTFFAAVERSNKVDAA